MNTIIIFDLDDTLINGKMNIPRQTYHMLNKFRNLHYFIGIISYNYLAPLVIKKSNLNRYTQHIVCGDLDRDVLFEQCLTNNIIKYNNLFTKNNIYYIDDRVDNLDIIKKHNPDVITYHCYNIYELYKFKLHLN
jgi:FMN phosphatase YigB (HAD superfamily)